MKVEITLEPVVSKVGSMDPAGAVIIAQAAGQVLGDIVDSIIEKAREGKYQEMSEIRNMIDQIYNRADAFAADKLDQLTSTLSGLGIIKKSPILDDAIAKRRQRYSRRISDLRNDIAELNSARQRFDLAEMEAEDSKTSSDFKKKFNKLKESAQNVQETAQKFKNVEQEL